MLLAEQQEQQRSSSHHGVLDEHACDQSRQQQHCGEDANPNTTVIISCLHGHRAVLDEHAVGPSRAVHAQQHVGVLQQLHGLQQRLLRAAEKEHEHENAQLVRPGRWVGVMRQHIGRCNSAVCSGLKQARAAMPPCKLQPRMQIKPQASVAAWLVSRAVAGAKGHGAQVASY